MAVTEQISRLAAVGNPLDELARLKGRLAWPVVLYIAAVMLPVAFYAGPIYMTGVRLLLIVMIIPLTARLIMGKYGRLLITDMLFLLHFVWIVVALAVNNPDQVVTNAGSTGIEFIGGYVLARAYIRDRDDFMALVRTLVIVTFCMFPFIIFETLTGNAIILNTLGKLPGIYSLRDIDIGIRMGLDRTQGVFVHPIHWGLFCSLTLSLCFVGLKGVYGNFWRLTISTVVGISGLLALSSGALLAILLQLGLFFWAYLFRNTARRWIILVGVGAFCYVVVDILSNRSPLMVFLSYATFSPHTAYWRTIIFDWGMINIWANPVFGLGLNDWVRPSYMYSGSMDNFWLVMGVRYGIPGFATIAAGYLLALWKIGRRDFDGDRVLWHFRRAWMFSFIGLSFTMSTVHLWHTIYSFVFFIFGAGMWMLTVMPRDAADTPATAKNGTAAPRHRDTATPTARTRGPDHARDHIKDHGSFPVQSRPTETPSQNRPAGTSPTTARDASAAPSYTRFPKDRRDAP